MNDCKICREIVGVRTVCKQCNIAFCFGCGEGQLCASCKEFNEWYAAQLKEEEKPKNERIPA